jgi:hypothetical protein
VVSALAHSEWAPQHRNPMGVGPHKEYGSARTHHDQQQKILKMHGVKALRSAEWSSHRNCMGVGDQQANRCMAVAP